MKSVFRWFWEIVCMLIVNILLFLVFEGGNKREIVIIGYKCLIYKIKNLLFCRNGKLYKLIWMKILLIWNSIVEIMSDGFRERLYWI